MFIFSSATFRLLDIWTVEKRFEEWDYMPTFFFSNFRLFSLAMVYLAYSFLVNTGWIVIKSFVLGLISNVKNYRP